MFLGSTTTQTRGNFRIGAGVPGNSAPATHVVIGAGDSGIYQTVRLIKQKVKEALSQPVVIQTVRSVLAGLPQNATQVEKSQAIVKWWMVNIRYRLDDDMSYTEHGLQWVHINECPRRFKTCEPVEMISDVPQILAQRHEDCLPGDTLLLTPRGFKAIADIREGDTIMGDGQWVKIKQTWDKGILPTVNLHLNSGSILTATADHKLLTVPKTLSKDASETKVSSVEIGDFLLTPESLPHGQESLSNDQAWLLGVYIADGWTDYKPSNGEPFRVSISGKDGHPKEAQKHRVKQICDYLGYETRWHERYIVIKNEQFAQIVGACGKRAHDKHLPTLNFTPATARAILEGLAVDGSTHGNRDLTYNTTSETLALQIRILHRMLGERTNIRRVDDHGGLGTHPIYRVGLVRPVRADGAKPWGSIKINEIMEGPELPVFDIEVEGHRFYLPEHDIIVHNCDGFVTGLGAFHSLAGIKWCPVIVALDAATPREFTHIYLIANLDGSWIPIDAVNANQPWGWQPSGAFRREVLC